MLNVIYYMFCWAIQLKNDYKLILLLNIVILKKQYYNDIFNTIIYYISLI